MDLCSCPRGSRIIHMIVQLISTQQLCYLTPTFHLFCHPQGLKCMELCSENVVLLLHHCHKVNLNIMSLHYLEKYGSTTTNLVIICVVSRTAGQISDLKCIPVVGVDHHTTLPPPDNSAPVYTEKQSYYCVAAVEAFQSKKMPSKRKMALCRCSTKPPSLLLLERSASFHRCYHDNNRTFGCHTTAVCAVTFPQT